MRPFLIGTAFTLTTVCMQAQDPGMQAAQMAAQQTQMAAQQASQQAMQDMQMASANATATAQQQAIANAMDSSCASPTPVLSAKSGTYSAALSVAIHADRHAAVYYTTDGWTPTKSSTRYTGPITIDDTTMLQAIAVAPCNARSRVAAAVYTLLGVTPPSSVAQTVTILHGAAPTISTAAAAAAATGQPVLAHGTTVPLVFTSEVNSKTVHVGDKIALTLADDLKVGDAVVAPKGATGFVIITEVDKPRGGGAPGEVYFRADNLETSGTEIKLAGSAAKEGQDQFYKASGLMIPVPLGIFVHGKDADIQPGAVFTAFVKTDTILPKN